MDRRRILWIIIDLDGWMDRSLAAAAGRQMVASIAGMQQYLAYISLASSWTTTHD